MKEYPMAQWTPSLEKHIREFAKPCSDAFRQTQEPSHSPSLLEMGKSLVEAFKKPFNKDILGLYRTICTEAGLYFSGKIDALVLYQIIKLAEQNGSDAAEPLKNTIAFEPQGYKIPGPKGP